MLQKLLDLTITLNFEENGGINVVSATLQNDEEDLELMLEVNTGKEEAVQKWSVICQSQCGHNIVLGWGDYLTLENDHVLLWPHNQTVCSLWFNGSTSDVLAVVGELWHEHQKLVGAWLPFSRFLNTSDFVGLIAGRHGKLAEGPQPLITRYQQVMQSHGFRTSITSRPPLHWNGEAWIELGNLVLILAGNSHIVASTVEARRVD